MVDRTKPLGRREFLRGAGIGLAGSALLPLLAACSSTPAAAPTSAPAAPTGAPAAATTTAAQPAATAPAGAGKAELKILQWSHFVPAYDTWFDKFAKDWGTKNGIPVTVDHMPHLEMPARLAAEVAAKNGHDLVEFAGQVLTYTYTAQLRDMKDLVDYAVGKWGAMEPLGKQLGQVNGKWVGLPNFYVAITPIVRKDLFQEVGVDYTKLSTWQEYYDVGKQLKAKGHAGGFAISHCNDANHNWRALMWCFGASEVGEDGKQVTIDSTATRDFLNFAKQLYNDALTEEVFAWDDSSDNRWLDSGVGGYIHDAISSMRSVQSQDPKLYDNMAIPPIINPKGPKAQMGMPDSNVYMVWNFTPQPNADAGTKFLQYFFDNYKEAFVQSTGYNMPFYADMFKKPMPVLGEDPKLSMLQDYRGEQLATFGHPGPPTAQATLVLQQYIIPDMVGIAVRGKETVDDAVKWAKDQLATIYKS